MSGDRPKFVVTEEWRTIAASKMATLKRGAQERIAEELGCSPGSITRLLSEDHPKTSWIAGPLSQKLGIAPPHPPLPDHRLEMLLEVGASLDGDELDHLVWLAQRLVSGREKIVRPPTTTDPTDMDEPPAGRRSLNDDDDGEETS